MFKEKIYLFLERCENFTHWLQVKYGRDNFWVSRKITKYQYYVVLTVALLILIFSDMVTQTGMVLTLILIPFLSELSHFIRGLYIKHVETLTYLAIVKGLRNPTEAQVIESVFVSVMMCLVLAGVWSLSFGAAILLPSSMLVLFYLLVDFFTAVTPLHPNEVEKQRVEELDANPVTQN